jgi:hypothetical protein
VQNFIERSNPSRPILLCEDAIPNCKICEEDANKIVRCILGIEGSYVSVDGTTATNVDEETPQPLYDTLSTLIGVNMFMGFKMEAGGSFGKMCGDGHLYRPGDDTCHAGFWIYRQCLNT